MIRRTLGTVRAVAVAGLIASLLFIAAPIGAVDRIKIDDNRNNLFLRYGIDTVLPDVFMPDRIQVRFPIETFLPGHSDTAHPIFGTALNPAPGTETTSDFALRAYPQMKYISETALPFIITDFGFYRAEGRSKPGIAVGGYIHDSALVARILVGDSGVTYIPLSRGVDQDGDGVWRGRPTWVGSFDCDGDGREEVLFWVDPVRDIGPRELFCLDMDAGKIKWSLPVASGVFRGQVFTLPDSGNPLLVFSAYGMGQNARDSNFSSSYGYVAVVDKNGQLLRRRIAAAFGDEIAVNRLPGDTVFLLEHTLPLVSTESEADAIPSHYMLSLVDRNLRIIKSVPFPNRLSTPWLSDYDGDGVDDVYTMMVDGTLRIFDRNLVLLAESGPSTLQRLVSCFPNWGEYENVFVFQTPRGSEVYSHDFHKLASIDSYSYYSPLAYDLRGRMTAFVAGNGGHFFAGRVAPRGWVQLISIFYQDYQIWVLSVLFSLAAGLIVMNLYRSRVSRQRRDLALAHAELAETHEKLKQAQETIISQEKFRQAKNIAGAFAHEIRNSLFPADSALTKLVQMGDLTKADPQRVIALRESIRTSVSRAVDITEQISSYTRLDTLYSPEPVILDEVFRDLVKTHELVLADARIAVRFNGPADTCVTANRQQLFTVFSNLLLNSLYALKGKSEAAVSIEWSQRDGMGEISFADNGIGIPADQLARIFDTFFSTKPATGTGLGLATSKKIIELYHGTISVASELNIGTTFTIKLEAISQGQN